MGMNRKFKFTDIFDTIEKQKKGGLRKVAELPNIDCCQDPEHTPPSHIVLEPGIYEYTCPSCGHVTKFVVNNFTCKV